MQTATCKDVITNFNFIQKCIDICPASVYVDYIVQNIRKQVPFMPNPSTYPYRRFPTIQVGAADHAARGTDAVKQELHALCAGSSKTVVTVECYPGTRTLNLSFMQMIWQSNPLSWMQKSNTN